MTLHRRIYWSVIAFGGLWLLVVVLLWGVGSAKVSPFLFAFRHPVTERHGGLVTYLITESQETTGTAKVRTVIARRVLPFGIVVNSTMTLAALFAAISLARFTVNRGRRFGHCDSCGCDMRYTPSGTCPECGSRPERGIACAV